MHQKQSGLALILVIFLVALLSIAMLTLASATYMSSRLSRSVEKQFKAEFLLKSGLNVARAIIQSNKANGDPGKLESWGMFTDGTTVDAKLLGITDSDVNLSLEIRPEDSKLPLNKLRDLSGGSPTAHNQFLKWRTIFVRLFQLLKFDEDKQADIKGPFKGRVFTSEELVANLIDYMDPDNDSYAGEGGFARGIEGEFNPDDRVFPEQGGKMDRIDELSVIPGFTSDRIRRLSNHVTPVLETEIDINFASKAVLMALDTSLSPAQADQIIHYREEQGPFNSSTYSSELPKMLPDFNTLSAAFIKNRSLVLQVITKVQFGDERYFLRAYVRPSPGTTVPAILQYELIG